MTTPAAPAAQGSASRSIANNVVQEGAAGQEPGLQRVLGGFDRSFRFRLAEPAEIVAAVDQLLSPRGPLRGTRVLVTAGPTREALDPIRFIGNLVHSRSTIAGAAFSLGNGPGLRQLTRT